MREGGGSAKVRWGRAMANVGVEKLRPRGRLASGTVRKSADWRDSWWYAEE